MQKKFLEVGKLLSVLRLFYMTNTRTETDEEKEELRAGGLFGGVVSRS